MIRVAVIGAGSFGRNHLRTVRANPRVELVAAVDLDAARAQAAAAEFGCEALDDWRRLEGRVDACVVATPTTAHEEVGCGLFAMGLHAIVEKPIAHDRDSARALVAAAQSAGRVLAVGHLERANPPVRALQEALTVPLFFEIHRMNQFAPRSLDVDVVLDLMIHDIDIVLSMVRESPSEVRAAGVRILSEKVDIANVRLAFPGGCVANLTASRVSTEKVRKLRLFQPHQYISIDYARQDGVIITVDEHQKVAFRPLTAQKREPLAVQLDAFLDAIETGSAPLVTGSDALAALEVSIDILDKIEVHAGVVRETLARFESAS